MKVLLILLLIIPSVAFGKQYYIHPDVVMNGNKITVVGKSNLPDCKDLSISIIGRSLSFMAQGEGAITNGTITSISFGPDGGMREGTYEAEIIAENPKFKNASLEQRLNDDRSSIIVSKKFTIVSGKISKYNNKAISNTKKSARDLANKLKLLEKQGRNMDKLRFSSNNYDHFQCMEQMRKLQPLSDQYQKEAENLSMGPKISLGAAASHLKLCVSCLDSASEYCDFAHKSIIEGIKLIDQE